MYTIICKMRNSHRVLCIRILYKSERLNLKFVSSSTGDLGVACGWQAVPSRLNGWTLEDRFSWSPLVRSGKFGFFSCFCFAESVAARASRPAWLFSIITKYICLVSSTFCVIIYCYRTFTSRGYDGTAPRRVFG